MWRKAKVFSAFLGNDKERETAGFLADMDATPQRLEYKSARRKTYYSWLDHYYVPFSENVWYIQACSSKRT